MKYQDFTISIQAASEGGYKVNVSSPAGEGTSTFALPFDADEVLQVLFSLGLTFRGAERDVVVEASPARPPTEIGAQLFESLFTGDTRDLFQQSLGMVEAERCGLRLRLQFDPQDEEVAKLASLPWELMYRPATNDYLNLSATTPLVRYLNVAQPQHARPQSDVLRVLVVMASPAGEAALDLDQEEQLIRTSWASKDGVEVDFLRNATKRALRAEVSQADRPYHVLHFMGHGGFDKTSGTGVLLLEDEEGKPDPVDGATLKVILDGTSMRLVVLNACNTARVTDQPGADPFAGVATALVQDGFTAVVAMQFPISDEAALEFAGEFYPRLAHSAPIDEAVSEGRKAIRIAKPTSLEWATPVLFMRSRDGVLIDVVPTTPGGSPNADPPTQGRDPIPGPAPLPVADPVPAPGKHVSPAPPRKPAPLRGASDAGAPDRGQPAHGRPTWQKAALYGGVPGALALVLLVLFWPGSPTPAELRMNALEPPTAGTGSVANASLTLLDEARIAIDSPDRLAEYEVTWASSDTLVAKVTPSDSVEGGQLTARVVALRPGTARISATIGELMDERALTVELSNDSRVEAGDAYDRVKALAGDSTVQDTVVVAAYRTLLDEHGFALEEDREEVQQAMSGLAAAVQAFPAADSAGAPDRPLPERVAAWTGFVSRFGSAREGPTLSAARTRLDALNQVLEAQVTADSLRTCLESELRDASGGYKYCASDRTMVSPGQSVGVYLVYRSPSAGRLVAKRDSEYLWTYSVDRRSRPGHTYFAFSAGDEGCREITVENDKSVILWRTHVAVGSEDACSADSGGP
jgi:hypothetical protein